MNTNTTKISKSATRQAARQAGRNAAITMAADFSSGDEDKIVSGMLLCSTSMILCSEGPLEPWLSDVRAARAIHAKDFRAGVHDGVRLSLSGTMPPPQFIGPPTPRGLVRYGQDGSRHILPGYVPPVFKRRKESRVYMVMVTNS